jgi:hypothetical protein
LIFQLFANNTTHLDVPTMHFLRNTQSQSIIFSQPPRCIHPIPKVPTHELGRMGNVPQAEYPTLHNREIRPDEELRCVYKLFASFHYNPLTPCILARSKQITANARLNVGTYSTRATEHPAHPTPITTTLWVSIRKTKENLRTQHLFHPILADMSYHTCIAAIKHDAHHHRLIQGFCQKRLPGTHDQASPVLLSSHSTYPR